MLDWLFGKQVEIEDVRQIVVQHPSGLEMVCSTNRENAESVYEQASEDGATVIEDEPFIYREPSLWTRLFGG